MGLLKEIVGCAAFLGAIWFAGEIFENNYRAAELAHNEYMNDARECIISDVREGQPLGDALDSCLYDTLHPSLERSEPDWVD